MPKPDEEAVHGRMLARMDWKSGRVNQLPLKAYDKSAGIAFAAART